MQSKNKPAIAADERQWVAIIKAMPCGVCGKASSDYEPSEAHELVQGQWFTSIPLCADCHRGSHNGLHGQARIWRVKKATELTVLNSTLRTIYAAWRTYGRVG